MENTQSIPSLQSTESSIQPQVKQNNSRPFIVIVASVLLTAVATGTFVYFWQKSTNEKTTKGLEEKITSLEEQISMMKNTAIQPQPTSSPTLSATAIVDPTANWQTYTNAKYGFSFRHPNLDDKCCRIAGPATGNIVFSMTFADPSTAIQGTNAPFVGLSISVVTNISSFEDYISQEKTALNQQYQAMDGSDPNHQGLATSTALAGQSGYILSGYSWDDINRYYIPFPNSSNVLVIGLGTKAPDNYTYDEILSTFQFNLEK